MELTALSVIHFPEFGGPHNQSLRLFEPLDAAGVDSITILPEGRGAERLREAEVPVEIVPLGRIRAVKSASVQAKMAARAPLDAIALARLFRKHQPDVVQLNGLINPLAAIVARSMGIPVVWQLLDTRPPMKIRHAMAPLVNALAEVVMPVGHAVAEAHPGIDFSPDRSVVFYPPVDQSRFRPGLPSGLRAELAIPDTAPLIGSVGNVNPQKGHEYFIEAAGQIRAAFPEARFVIAGHIYPNHSVYYEQLQQQARSLGLNPGKDLFFLGSRDDIPDVVSAFDVFVLASVPNSEGTPTAILEAMACGKPVVSTSVASVPEAVADGKTGFVVEPENPEAIAERVIEILRDPDLKRTLGVAGADRISESFSLEQCVDAHLRAYTMAIERRNRTSMEQKQVVNPAPNHKQTQIDYYDEEADPLYETTRPHGTPVFFQELLANKFARSVAAFGSLQDRTVLTVCGGSGLDAEYLAHAGATVYHSDLSPNAVARARTRFANYLPNSLSPSQGGNGKGGTDQSLSPEFILTKEGPGGNGKGGESLSPSEGGNGKGGTMGNFLVADVEHLPFPDRSIDLVYVHDGLHHLEDPLVGLREMTRVARYAISLTEPAQAAATALAVRLGRAEEIEDAGNRVARLDPAAVRQLLEEEGFTVLVATRYAMYYKHRPGWVMHALSLPGVRRAAWSGYQLGNRVVGRWGNKLTIQAVRKG